MTFAIGVGLFAVGIVVSLVLHEAGHALSARFFGMKVTRFFVGYGPTLVSFRRRGVEFGVKAIPAGAFVKIVGMIQQDDEVAPADQHRAMWRYPVWKRTVVMSAGSLVHFGLGLFILWLLFAFVALPDQDRLQSQAVRIDEVASCVQTQWVVDPATGQQRACTPRSDPPSAAARAGLRPGDVITAIDGRPVTGWDAMTRTVRSDGGRTVQLTYQRDGVSRTVPVTLPTAERERLDVPAGTAARDVAPADLERVGVLGVTPRVPTSVAGPVRAFGLAGRETGTMVAGTFTALKSLPQKVPALLSSLTGAHRDPDTPVSVVGASRIGGELFARGDLSAFILMLASLNFFIGLFNLLPVLPADGGHIAIAWFERARSWCYARLGRPDPGRVDYLKLAPLTLAVIVIFGGFALLNAAADIVNPIRVF